MLIRMAKRWPLLFNRGGHLKGVYYPYCTDSSVGTSVTGHLIGVGRLMGGHLIGV